MMFDFSSPKEEDVKEEAKAKDNLKVPSLRRKPEKTRRTFLGMPQPYEKLGVKQEADILSLAPSATFDGCGSSATSFHVPYTNPTSTTAESVGTASTRRAATST